MSATRVSYHKEQQVEECSSCRRGNSQSWVLEISLLYCWRTLVSVKLSAAFHCLATSPGKKCILRAGTTVLSPALSLCARRMLTSAQVGRYSLEGWNCLSVSGVCSHVLRIFQHLGGPELTSCFEAGGLVMLVFSAVLWPCHIPFTSAPFPARKWMPICVLLRYPLMQSSTRANHLIGKVRFTANMATQHYCFSFTVNERQALWAYTELFWGQRLSGSLLVPSILIEQ